jgi:hypothetical protein
VNELGKVLIYFGAVLLLLGLLLMAGGRLHLPLGRLPGDILYRRRNMTIYFPVATCILLSIVLTLLFYLAGRWRR